MRVEIIVILWAIAAAGVGASVWSRSASETLVSSTESPDSSLEEYPASEPSDQISVAAAGGALRDFNNISVEDDLIFSSQEVASSAQAPASTTNVTQNNITLRGIIGAAGSLRAVFDDPAGGSSYVVIAEGESIAGNQITGITPDSVSVRASDGAIRSISLRGSGEAP